MKKKIQVSTVLDYIGKVEKTLFFVSFISITLLICIQVVCRKAGIVGFVWLDEVSRYLLVITTFLAGSVAVSSRSHPTVDVLNKLLPSGAVSVIRKICYLLCALLCGFTSYYSYVYIAKIHKVGSLTSSLRIPLWIIYTFFLLGFGGMTVRWVLLAFEKKDEATSEKENKL